MIAIIKLAITNFFILYDRDIIQQMNQRNKLPHLKSFEDTYDYLNGKQGIISGFRINYNSPQKILKTVFMVHNETGNIWTHLLPAVLFFIFLIYLIVKGSTNLNSFSQPNLLCSGRIQNLVSGLQKNQSRMAFFEQSKESQQLISEYQSYQVCFQSWIDQIYNKIAFFSSQKKVSNLKLNQKVNSVKTKLFQISLPNIQTDNQRRIQNSHSQQNLTIAQKNIESKLANQLPVQYFEISIWPIYVLLLSAVICLLCSVAFHLFLPISPKTFYILRRLDYAGINILIIGSSFPAIYYSMYCSFSTALLYLGIISILGISLFVFSLFEYIHRPSNFKLKSGIYAGFGLSLVIPIAHSVLNELMFGNYGDNFTMKGAIQYYLLCGLFYLFGLYVYTARCPEKNNPGAFQICGKSHQIWHCFVVLGIIATCFGAFQNLSMRIISQC